MLHNILTQYDSFKAGAESSSSRAESSNSRDDRRNEMRAHSKTRCFAMS